MITGDLTADGCAATLRTALRDFRLDIELAIPRGHTVALLGPNGAGKSTTVELLSGARALDAQLGGHITLDGRVLDDPAAGAFVAPHERKVGVVFQDHLLFDHLSVLDNVAFAKRSAGASRSESRAEAGRWLEMAGATELAAARPADLSGGEAQRVAIARTLAAEPDLLLLDEPFAALDVSSRAELRRLVRGHLAEAMTPTLVITHDPTDAFLLADTLVVIEHGRVVQRGSADDLRGAPATPYVAALSGANVFAGSASGGTVLLDDHDFLFSVADTSVAGQVLVTVLPRSVALHTEQPHGSQRNVWQASIQIVEPLGDIVRVTLGGAIDLAVDVTPGAVDALGLRPGATVWAAVKASELAVQPA